jgi:hypothetical protein
VIQNKHNLEWGQCPKNFINLSILTTLIERLAHAYRIVYIRPCPDRVSDPSYSWDSNTDVFYNLDFEWLDNHPEYDVQTLESIQASCSTALSYNEVKLWLFAKCKHYISVQGGGSLLIPFFAKRLLVLHKEGWELQSSVYEPGSWFQEQLCSPIPKESDDPNDGMALRVVTQDQDIVPVAESLFLIDPQRIL